MQCEYCGKELKKGKEKSFAGTYMCEECFKEHTLICDRCGGRMWRADNEGNDNIVLCSTCYENHYTHCERCGCLILYDSAMYFDDDDDPYCDDCYNILSTETIIHSVGKSNLYSSQYALTGIVFCGECGANYRRVTWARDGKKKIVWRCMERLENGIRNCKNSPTINEDKLKCAILSGLAQIALDVSDIAEMVKSEIGTVIHKNDEQNEYTIKAKIKKLEKEIQVLNQIVNEADDNQVYLDKIKACEEEVTRLNSKLIECSKCEMNDIEDLINSNEVNMLEYFDAVVRNTVESVLVISQNKIKIKYVGGIEMTKSI